MADSVVRLRRPYGLGTDWRYFAKYFPPNLIWLVPVVFSFGSASQIVGLIVASATASTVEIARGLLVRSRVTRLRSRRQNATLAVAKAAPGSDPTLVARQVATAMVPEMNVLEALKGRDARLSLKDVHQRVADDAVDSARVKDALRRLRRCGLVSHRPFSGWAITTNGFNTPISQPEKRIRYKSSGPNDRCAAAVYSAGVTVESGWQLRVVPEHEMASVAGNGALATRSAGTGALARAAGPHGGVVVDAPEGGGDRASDGSVGPDGRSFSGDIGLKGEAPATRGVPGTSSLAGRRQSPGAGARPI